MDLWRCCFFIKKKEFEQFNRHFIANFYIKTIQFQQGVTDSGIFYHKDKKRPNSMQAYISKEPDCSFCLYRNTLMVEAKRRRSGSILTTSLNSNYWQFTAFHKWHSLILRNCEPFFLPQSNVVHFRLPFHLNGRSENTYNDSPFGHIQNGK